MKRLSIYFFSLALVFAISGCQKFLDTPPENALLWDEAMETPEDAQRLLSSSYDVLRSGNFYGGAVWLLSDLMADNMDGRNLSGDYLAYHTHNTGIFISASRDLWFNGYLPIYRSNLLIERIDEVQGFADTDKARMIAEAKFLRAMCHFEVVRFFAQPYGFSADNSHLGIPLRLEANTGQLSRASVGEVYTQIVADFQDAAAVLPSDNRGYATSWAAKAMLAKVYFQMNEYQNAYDLADDIINNGPFALNSSITARFSNTVNSENIFSLVSTGNLDQAASGLIGNYRSANLAVNEPTGRILPSMHSIAVADTNDKRRIFYIAADTASASERIFLTRFNAEFFNLPIVHLAEIMLIRAESAVETGNMSQAETDINSIRSRAGLSAVTPGQTSTALLTLIRNERRLEMVGEGNRLHDLKRQATNGNPSLTINGAPWDCPGMAVQLPDDETAGNPDIELNPQGGCN
jgi:tetratricopeptide (TPR) repeat protein